VAVTSLEIKLTSKIQIIDRLLLAQRQAPWKVPFSGGGIVIPDDIPTDIPTDLI